MGLFDRFTGRNVESLEAFLRRMLRGIMNQDPESSLPGYFDGLESLSLEELLQTFPATMMTITEQYDQYLAQGMPSQETLEMIDAHRQSLLMGMGITQVEADVANTDTLEDFVLDVVNRESDDLGPFRIDRELIAFVVAEIRAFDQKNPRNTLLAMQGKLQARLGQ